MMDNFIDAVRDSKFDNIATGPEETLESHLIVFAAEQARLEKRVVSLEELYQV